jgi:hypothetical protein
MFLNGSDLGSGVIVAGVHRVFGHVYAVPAPEALFGRIWLQVQVVALFSAARQADD